jgi:hypothetical protein
MITASHLPPNRNGAKFFTADGGLDKPDIKSEGGEGGGGIGPLELPQSPWI